MKKILLLSISIAAIIGSAFFLQSYSGGIAENSAYHYAMQVNGKGAQVSSAAQSCNICHGGSTAAPDLANEGGFSFNFNNNSTTYSVATFHNLTIEFDDHSGSQHGYELIALDSMMNGVGSFVDLNDSVGVGTYTVDGGPKMYPFSKHIFTKTHPTIAVRWIAPTEYDGEVTFYIIGVSSNDNSMATGDNVYYDKLKVTCNNISIKEYDAQNFFDIYSENGKIQFNTELELQNAKIEIYDVLGQISRTETKSSNQFSIDTGKKNGIVFVRITNGSDVYTSKLKL